MFFGCHIFMTRIMATSAAIEDRITASSGPRVLDVHNSTPANVTEQAAIGGNTSSARLKPDMMTTM